MIWHQRYYKYKLHQTLNLINKKRQIIFNSFLFSLLLFMNCTYKVILYVHVFKFYFYFIYNYIAIQNR